MRFPGVFLTLLIIELAKASEAMNLALANGQTGLTRDNGSLDTNDNEEHIPKLLPIEDASSPSASSTRVEKVETEDVDAESNNSDELAESDINETKYDQDEDYAKNVTTKGPTTEPDTQGTANVTFPPTTEIPTTLPPPKPTPEGTSSGKIAGIVLAIVAAVAAGGVALYYFAKK